MGTVSEVVPYYLPLDPTEYRFKNCTYTAGWYAKFQQTSDVPAVDTTWLLVDGLDEFWEEYNLTDWTLGTVMGELLEDLSYDVSPLWNTLEAATWDFVVTQCRDEYCANLPWQGNADLSGRGMLVSYFVQAGFTTVYMFVVGLARLNKRTRLFKKGTKMEHFMVAFQESTKTFLDSCLFFCIVMFIATIYIFSVSLHDKSKMITSYVQFSSVFISIFTIFPALILHACYSNHLRREKFRQTVWGIIAAMTAAVAGMSLAIPSSSLWRLMRENAQTTDEITKLDDFMAKVEDPEVQLHWEMECVDDEAINYFYWVQVVLICTIAAFSLFYLLLVKNVLRIPFLRTEKRSCLERFRKNWWWVASTFSFIGMWGSLGVFMYFRMEFNKRSGALTKDKEWGFGQILALATWAPVLIELIFILVKGPTEALTGKMSDKYQVVPVPELERRSTDESAVTFISERHGSVTYSPIDVPYSGKA